MNTSDTLNKAADLIEERGWIRATGWADSTGATETTPLCIEGAIQAVTGLKRAAFDCDTYEQTRPLYECPAYRAVSDYIQTDLDLWYWNDDHAESAEQVVEVLRACAVIEASRERETAEATA